MNKTSKSSILGISVALLGLVWVFAVIAYNLIFDLSWMCWGSIAGTALAIMMAELYLLALRKGPGAQATEQGAVGILFTLCYLVIVVLLNSVFVLLDCGDFNLVLVTLNLVIDVCYVILIMWVKKDTARLTTQLVKTEVKTAPSKEISRKLGELLSITEDAEIRGRILKLKEAVDYSTNISTGATSAAEARMNAQLDELVQLTLGQADRLIILNKVGAAEKIWKMRSSAASSVR